MIPFSAALLLLPQDPEVARAFAAWRQEHGATWVMRTHLGTDTARFLYGGRVEPALRPQQDADFVTLARAALDASAAMFGLDPDGLVDAQVQRLPLARIGTTDKVAVLFRQVHRGVPVVGGGASVLLQADGSLLAVDATGLPHLGRLDPFPATTAAAALAVARTEYQRIEQLPATQAAAPALVIYPFQPGRRVVPRLAWAVELRTPAAAGLPAGRRLYLAADDGAGALLGHEALVHACGFGPNDLQGRVDAYATPGILPDIAANPETLHAMRALRVRGSAGSAVTDESGAFVLPYTGTTAVTLQFEFSGPYAEVGNAAGADYQLSQSFAPGVFQSVVMNPAQVESITAQANAFDGIMDFRAFLKAVDPNENTMDFPVRANVNLASTCNAYWDGASINFFAAGGTCPNTAYSSIIAHEEGHWANALEGSGNGSDGFGEGNADVYAMYVYDSPLIGADVFGPGTRFRTGENSRPFCGDANPGCHGEPHLGGEVLMGALWKVRRNLNDSFGDAAGDLTADSLFVNWMNAYNDGAILSVIEDHWLSLDDDDGNLANGTPRFPEIDAGFREQGFPGVDPGLLHIGHAPLGDTSNEFGPYVVGAQIDALAGNVVAGAEVQYRVDGGAFVGLPMQALGGNQWQALLPGQDAVARVEYRIVARDQTGYRQFLPASGTFSFLVAVVQEFYAEDFDGPDDAGWTHAAARGGDDWQRGAPAGKSTDPPAAFSAPHCWGNDLGNGTDGRYVNNAHNYLLSPVIDCSAFQGVTLRYRRLLSVGASGADAARIAVFAGGAWNQVWPAPGERPVDYVWTLHEVDLSAYADGNPLLQLRFELESDFISSFGGWNVDDLRLLSIRATGDRDLLLLSGPTSAGVGQTLDYGLSAAPPDAPYWLYASPRAGGTVIQGQPFDIGTPFLAVTSGTTSGFGTAAWTSPPLPARAAGRTVYLEARADQGARTFDSNLLRLQIQ